MDIVAASGCPFKSDNLKSKSIVIDSAHHQPLCKHVSGSRRQAKGPRHLRLPGRRMTNVRASSSLYHTHLLSVAILTVWRARSGRAQRHPSVGEGKVNEFGQADDERRVDGCRTKKGAHRSVVLVTLAYPRGVVLHQI